MIRRHLAGIIICASIVVLTLYLLTRHQTNTMAMKFSIATLWNSVPITNHRPVQISLSSTNDKDQLLIEIDAPFFNDPAPVSSPSSPPGSYPELWNYEVVELFFLASSTNHYLELEFSPHGHYLVLLLLDRRKELKQMVPLPYYNVERPTSDRWIGRAHIPRSLFPAHINRFNAYAIHGQDEKRTYEALYPATIDKEKPDFHRLEFFQAFNFDSLLSIGEHDGDHWNTD
ncbi:unnamed protein product [Rotaria magnacalcarata]|uniref:Uncharacterized protein n=1 Tax=Rotaria magnacalcarata TaxID=392030 RepID=A0A819CKQ9_9BILA|nr:unnamed protein product [Rotaria magnacalcarata]CAF2159695.1 unnamed protein product [Rotaria magnacalcarata]CAF3813961.1 unnamed protein product [Rotaria magnacalcarata]CAF3915097.1 unnamed protein product [Rotaria magnacalcarata]